jgi:hypothetical protein
MHADFQALLALRDAAPVDEAVREHVQRCETCSAELVRLREQKRQLLSLKDFDPPARMWGRVQAQLQSSPGRWSTERWPSLSAVAAVALLITLACVWSIRVARGPADLAYTVPAGAEHAEIGSLMAHSQRLEAVLHSLPPRPPVEQAGTSATIDELQTRIQLLDVQLAGGERDVPDPQQVAKLWNARVQLLNSLVYVRYAEAAGNGDRAGRPLELGVI